MNDRVITTRKVARGSGSPKITLPSEVDAMLGEADEVAWVVDEETMTLMLVPVSEVGLR